MFRTVLLALALAGCVDGLGVTASAVTDPIQACPVPALGAITGHEADFYHCVEDVVACGPDGYPLGYGVRYAQRFHRHTRPKMSPAGRIWIDEVLVCLQEELRASIDASTPCDVLRDVAYDSHPYCYVEAGFCELSFLDILRVVWTIDLADWADEATLRQVFDTLESC